MRFVIDPSIKKVFPHVSTAWIRIQLSQEAKADIGVIETLKAEALTKLLETVPSGQNVDLEKVSTISQSIQIYRNMKINPKKIKPTHYAFSLRLLKDKKWPRSIGPLVDVYLANQIKHMMPHGGFDISTLLGDTIKLLVSEKEHTFQPLGVQENDETRMERTKVGEVLYQDISKDSTVTLTRYFNHRDCESTKIVDAEDESQSTKDFVLIIECVDGSEEGKAKLQETANDLEKAYRLVYGKGFMKSYVRIVELAEDGEASVSLDWTEKSIITIVGFD